jgi:hypothetical protein
MGPLGYHSYLGFMEWRHRDAFQRDGNQCSGHSFGEDVKCTVATMRVSFCVSFPKADLYICVCVLAIVFGRVFRRSRLSDLQTLVACLGDTRSYRLLKTVGNPPELLDLKIAKSLVLV